MVYRGEVPAGLALDSTLPTLQGSFSFPVKYGYASVGRVVDVGTESTNWWRATWSSPLTRTKTATTVPATVVIRLPQELDPRIGVFAANVETALNALLDAAPRLGKELFVIGQGVVGLLVTQLVRRAGASLVITSDLYEKRRSCRDLAARTWLLIQQRRVSRSVCSR